MADIKVIDAPCGAGKTSWAIQYINENPEKSFIYCAPFLDELSRIKEACPHRFVEPHPYNGSKLDDFNDLLADGKDIVVTHTTFLNATSETLDAIREGEYTIIIDEALDVVTDFNTTQRIESQECQKVGKGDIEFLLNNNIIQIGKDHLVTWLGGQYRDDYKYSEMQHFAKLHRLYCMDNRLLLTVFPVEIFDCFKDVYVMTYLFEGSMFKYYADLFNLNYRKCSVISENGKYTIGPYTPIIDFEMRQRYGELITIFHDKRNRKKGMNSYNRTDLSANWFSRNEDKLKDLKNNLSNYFNRCIPEAKASNGDIMWTCKKSCFQKLKGAGYTVVRNLKKEERQLPESERSKLEKELSCFVPCNAKATNIYAKRWALAYVFNCYMNPQIIKFFESKNEERKAKGQAEIKPDTDLYSLSNMLQWIFRSRIRNFEPIEIFIPSTRMRKLLIDWINCEDLPEPRMTFFVKDGLIQKSQEMLNLQHF